MTTHQYTQIAIIGAGIVGLAHAYAAAKRGYRVVLFERSPHALGASIRNFGLSWLIGQPAGERYQLALLSRALWLEVSAKAGFWCNANGSLHLAYQADEQAVLEEFYASIGTSTGICELLTPAATLRKSSAVRPNGLRCALWSEAELTVDPREAIRRIPDWLAHEYGVELRFNTAVRHIDTLTMETIGESWHAEQIFVCSGEDFETLYPDTYAASGISKVKLQMMRSIPQPSGWVLGPSLCAGLTLTHYDAFKSCKTLPALTARFREQMPAYVQHGIHVLLAQNKRGELIIGDSHEYGAAFEPFDKQVINQLILDYLRTFAQVPTFEIAERWYGVYSRIEGMPALIIQPEAGVTIVNALSGAGMTLSFGLAERAFS